MTQAGKIARGRGAFADDIALPGLLHARVLRSPHAHARIARMDISPARALPGVAAILTHESVSRTPVPSGGPWENEDAVFDAVMLDRKVRFAGDRVAVVAAEDPEIAHRACEAIRVDYELLPAVANPEAALRPGAPVLHDEPDAVGIADAARNLVCEVRAETGDVAAALAAADRVCESRYHVAAVPPSPIEPHVAVTWLDDDQRLVVRASTDVPFHVRRVLASLLGIPAGWIRVIPPRVGGGFGCKQEVVVEDLCGLLTLRTGRPVRLELTREEELTAVRLRPALDVTIKSGVRDGRLTALEVGVLLNAGAHGGHAPDLLRAVGAQMLSLYRCPSLRYQGRAAYTNLPPAGATRGYGAPQGFFALESHVDEVAAALGEDPLEFRRRNHVREGDHAPMVEALGGHRMPPLSGGLEQAIEDGAREIGWSRRWKAASTRSGPLRRGIGMALAQHIPGFRSGERGAASLALGEDGSFSLVVGPSHMGPSVDIRAIAASTLGVPVERIVPRAADTDGLPFDPGARAPASYVTGRAVEKAARLVLDQMLRAAGGLLKAEPGKLAAQGGRVRAREGRSVTFEQIAAASLGQPDPVPIAATAFFGARESPPVFAAVFAEVEVDEETGEVRVLKLVEAVDAAPGGDPRGAQARIQGDAVQALGYALFERMPMDGSGRLAFRALGDYTMATAIDAPEVVALLPPRRAPLGSKAIGEVPAHGVAPAIANAVAHATGVRLRELPLTPERVLAAIERGGE